MEEAVGEGYAERRHAEDDDAIEDRLHQSVDFNPFPIIFYLSHT